MTKASEIIKQMQNLVDLHGDVCVLLAYGDMGCGHCFYKVESMAQYDEEEKCIFIESPPIIDY